MLIACPHCHTLNRVPDQRLAEDPSCGRCKQGLLAGVPVAVSDASFDAVVQRTELPVVVDVWAPWCGPCRAMAPQFEQAARQLKGRALLLKLDSDENPRIAGRLGIRSIPTLLVFHQGRELKRSSGTMPAGELVRWVGAG